MKLFVVCIAIAPLLIGCSREHTHALQKQTPLPAAAGATSMVEFSMGKCAVGNVTFEVRNAPAFETALQQWKRTKANYHAADKAERALTDALWNCMDQAEDLDLPYFEKFQDAEKSLESAKCGRVCVPVKTP